MVDFSIFFSSRSFFFGTNYVPIILPLFILLWHDYKNIMIAVHIFLYNTFTASRDIINDSFLHLMVFSNINVCKIWL